MSAIDRILASLEALSDYFTRRTNRAYVWSYSVESATETSFSGRRLSPDCPFDDMPEIPLMPGIAGAGVKPARGSIALVAFVDGDPAKPRVVGWDQTVPVSVTIDTSSRLQLGPSSPLVELAGGGQAIHRVGDAGTGGTFTAGIVPGQLTYAGPDGTVWNLTFQSATPGSPVVIALVPVAGSGGAVTTKATTGSGKGTCGG